MTCHWRWQLYISALAKQNFTCIDEVRASFSDYPQWWHLKKINTLRPRQNGRHFPDDTFKCIFLFENAWIWINISLEFVPKVRINNIPALVQIMAWRRSGDKPLSEPMMVRLPTHICVTRPQWVIKIKGPTHMAESGHHLRKRLQPTPTCNYQSRQIHQILNRENPSKSFRDIDSNQWASPYTSNGQPWASSYGSSGQMNMMLHNYKSKQFHRTSNKENPSSSLRNMRSGPCSVLHQALCIISNPLVNSNWSYSPEMLNNIWSLCLVPTSTTRFASDVGYRMAKF